jgi:hypothetical protein
VVQGSEQSQKGGFQVMPQSRKGQKRKKEAFDKITNPDVWEEGFKPRKHKRNESLWVIFVIIALLGFVLLILMEGPR